MANWAAFLRAINVGGRRVSSADLCAPFEELGFDDVASFRASGNVVFSTKSKSEAAVRKKVEKALRDALGYDVVAFMRNTQDMQALAAARPFGKSPKGKMHVAFLHKPPSAAVKKKVLALATPKDELKFGKRELYWLTAGAMMDSDLDMAGLSKLTGETTFRTQGTIEQIAAKWFTPEA